MGWRRHSTKQQMQIFAQRVKRFRTMAGMTQRQLAKAMHVGTRTIQNVERATNEPRYTTINKFNRLQTAYAAAHARGPLTEVPQPPQDREVEEIHV